MQNLKTRFPWYLYLSLPASVVADAISKVQQQIADADGDITTLRTKIAPSWAESPNVRGSIDLLWTCVLTLTICVYTVIHLNIPHAGETKWGFFVRKSKWVILAIVFPELGLTIAFMQWYNVRKLWKWFNNQNTKWYDISYLWKTPTGMGDQAKRFDILYCHYCVMGGFAVEVGHIHDYLQIVTLSPSGIQWLAERGWPLPIDRDTVLDKSKSDWIAKSIACIQVLWMVIQCIGRKKNNYPITLLEIHTLAHVFCAFGMLLLWMKKPMDIQCPTIIDASQFQPEIAYMLLMSDCGKDYDKLAVFSPQELELRRRSAYGRQEPKPTKYHRISRRSFSNYRRREREPSYPREVAPGEVFQHCIGPRLTSTKCVELSIKDQERWRLAETYIMKSQQVRSADIDQSMYMVKTSTNFAADFYDDFTKERRSHGITLFTVILFFFSFCYAGVHLAAWQFKFPTELEKWLWRISSILIAAGAPSCFMLLAGLGILIPDSSSDTTYATNRTANDVKREGWCRVSRILGAIICGILLMVMFLAYFAARLYLIVESFASIRALPIGAYITVDWSVNLFHLG